MNDVLDYDEAEAKQEEATYRTDAAAERRHLVREMLDFEADDRVLSVGCGPGFEPLELAETMGEDGRVLGLDRSEPMLALATDRCADAPRVTLARGDATQLPVADEAFDAAIAVQVYEYVRDVETAAAELYRALRPGGRAVVYDTDWASLVWRSANAPRMDRVLDAFDDHCPRPRLGSELCPFLREAGFDTERVEPSTVCETRFEEGTFGSRLAESIRAYAAEHDAVGSEEADAWMADLRETERCGAAFFSLTQYLYLVRKPADEEGARSRG